MHVLHSYIVQLQFLKVYVHKKSPPESLIDCEWRQKQLSYLVTKKVIKDVLIPSIFFKTLDNNFLQTGIYVTVATHSFFDLFMVMYLGNEIKLSSDRLSYCLYESQWMEQSKFCRKCLINFSEILQKPQKLVIEGLYSLNLETFTSAS